MQWQSVTSELQALQSRQMMGIPTSIFIHNARNHRIASKICPWPFFPLNWHIVDWMLLRILNSNRNEHISCFYPIHISTRYFQRF